MRWVTVSGRRWKLLQFPKGTSKRDHATAVYDGGSSWAEEAALES